MSFKVLKRMRGIIKILWQNIYFETLSKNKRTACRLHENENYEFCRKLLFARQIKYYWTLKKISEEYYVRKNVQLAALKIASQYY